MFSGRQKSTSPDRTDEAVVLGESERRAAEVGRALRAALNALPLEDRLILRMIFAEGLKISEVARSLCVEQRPLYRRLPKLLGQLREILSQEVSREEIDELLATPTFDLDAGLRSTDPGNRPVEPRQTSRRPKNER